MATKEILPSWFHKVSKKLPEESKAKLIELHKLYRFDEDKIDCFSINNGDLNKDNLEDFKSFLVQEDAKPAVSSKSARTPVAPTPARAAVAAGGLAKILGAKRAGVAAIPSQRTPGSQPDSLTPDPKRQRQGEALSGTPEPTSKVSVKSSVNQQLIKPDSLGASGTGTEMKLLGDRQLWTGPNGRAYRWMDEAIETRAAAQDEHLTAMEGEVLAAIRARPAARLSLTEGEDEVATGIIGATSQAEVVLCGRLACEGLEGRLNERSILLEGSQSSCKGARVHLNLSGCPNVAAFPGQVVGVLGRSGTGSEFHARDFVAGIPPPLPVALRPDAQLNLMVASGPFCKRDSLDFSPLEQMFAHAMQSRPRVLLLMGPFLDSSNLKVSSGDTVIPGEAEPRPYEEVYTHYVLPTLARGIAPLRRANPATEVLIVPSLDEVLCFHPLPQPPLDVSLCIEASQFITLRNLGVKFLPNPAHLEMNGMKVSISSADALSPVLREIVLRPNERKIEEGLRLLLHQRSLFPVLPRDPVQVSESRAAALSFPYADNGVPDLCIFPSAIGAATGTFVDGTAFVNPGVLCRGTLGTFAEVTVLPDRSRAGGNALKLSERTRVDVMKLES